MKYSMFIGRWQPWHKGHRWLIDQRLNDNKNVLICIRDMETDENNPYTAEEVKINVEKSLNDLVSSKRVKVIIIPDIESVNYGRGVGYEINEYQSPSESGAMFISATKIRDSIKNKDDKWKSMVDESLHNDIESYLS